MAIAAKYDLDNILKTPKKGLTRDQLNNFDKIMAMVNDEIPAGAVDIGPVIEEDIKQMRRKGSYSL